VLLRASDLRCGPEGDVAGRVAACAFRGADVLYRIELASGRAVKVLAAGFVDVAVGQPVRVSIAAAEALAFPRPGIDSAAD
jgi:iron(III) transport system ATP-binding protein